MSYEPEYGDCEDWGYDDDYMDPEDSCGYGSFGMPQLGVEECEFDCPARASCRAIYDAQKDCVNPIRNSDELQIIRCPFFHMGNCYIGFSNYTPSKLSQVILRLKCRRGKVPENPARRHYEA